MRAEIAPKTHGFALLRMDYAAPTRISPSHKAAESIRPSVDTQSDRVLRSWNLMNHPVGVSTVYLPRVLAAVFLIIICSSPLRAGDWNTAIGGRPDRTSLSTDVGPSSPELLWEGSTPAQLAGFPVTEGSRMVSSRTESFGDIVRSTWIVAQELTTGEILWREQLPINFGDSWSSQVVGIRDGRVYASRASSGSNSEYLYALDATDGSIAWRSEDLVNQAGSVGGLAFTVDGDLIHGNFQSLTRLSRSDGRTVWTTPRQCPTSNGCAAAVSGERAYVWDVTVGPGGGELRISIFDVRDGSKLYSSVPLLQGGITINQITPLVGPDGTVYAPLANNSPADAFIALEDTGTALVERWRIPMGYTPFASFGVAPDGSVYTYSRENEVLRLDPATGDVLNASERIPHDAAAFQPHMAIDANGTVFLTNGGVNESFLYSFEPDLTLRWSEIIPIGRGPALAQDGVLIVCGSGTNVRAYQTPLNP